MSQENLLSSIKNLAATGASIAQTRLELLSVDVQIARDKSIRLMVMIVCALFFLFVGLVIVIDVDNTLIHADVVAVVDIVC